MRKPIRTNVRHIEENSTENSLSKSKTLNNRKLNIVSNNLNNFIKAQKDLEPEFVNAINEHFWDLV